MLKTGKKNAQKISNVNLMQHTNEDGDDENEEEEEEEKEEIEEKKEEKESKTNDHVKSEDSENLEEPDAFTLTNIIKDIKSPNKKSSSSSSSSSTNTSPELPTFKSEQPASALTVPSISGHMAKPIQTTVEANNIEENMTNSIEPERCVSSRCSNEENKAVGATSKRSDEFNEEDNDDDKGVFRFSDDEICDDSNASNQNMQTVSSMQTGASTSDAIVGISMQPKTNESHSTSDDNDCTLFGDDLDQSGSRHDESDSQICESKNEMNLKISESKNEVRKHLKKNLGY